MDIVFSNKNWPENCVKNAFNSITYLLEYKDDENSQYFKKSFENSGIVNFLIENLNHPVTNKIKNTISLIVSLLWHNNDLWPKFFNCFRQPISQFMDLFYKVTKNNSSNVDERELYNLVTNLIYTLSFEIPSSEDAYFFYIYADFVLHMRQVDNHYPCNLTFILYIIQNITKFAQSLETIYRNQLIIEAMSEALKSTDIQKIRSTTIIIKALIDYNFDLSVKFDLLTFFKLIDEEDNDIIERSALFISHYLTKKPYSSELTITRNILGYFLPAFFRSNFRTKKQLIDTLCIIIKIANASILKEMVKQNIVRILAQALSFDDDDLILQVLQCLIIILKLDPIINDKGINIALDDFDSSEGVSKFEELNYDNEKIYRYSEEFVNIYERLRALNEENNDNY